MNPVQVAQHTNGTVTQTYFAAEDTLYVVTQNSSRTYAAVDEYQRVGESSSWTSGQAVEDSPVSLVFTHAYTDG